VKSRKTDLPIIALAKFGDTQLFLRESPPVSTAKRVGRVGYASTQAFNFFLSLCLIPASSGGFFVMSHLTPWVYRRHLGSLGKLHLTRSLKQFGGAYRFVAFSSASLTPLTLSRPFFIFKIVSNIKYTHDRIHI
jgi:hypothetical protein